MARTIKVNGTDLKVAGSRSVRYWEGPLGAPELIGDPFPVPFRMGLVDVNQTPAGRQIIVGLTVYADDADDFHDKHRALEQIVYSPNSALTLTRELTVDASTETVTCSARFLDGLEPDMQSHKAGNYALRFVNTDGVWYAGSATTASVSGTTGSIVMPGTERSRRLTLTFSGVSGAQTFSNTTTGATVVVTGDKTVNDVVLDVDDWTATQDGSNVIGTVTHSGDYHWMTVDPGTNSFTLAGGGTVDVSATAAYL